MLLLWLELEFQTQARRESGGGVTATDGQHRTVTSVILYNRRKY